jgi:hypothetical protein
VIARCIINAGTWSVFPECSPSCPTEPPAHGSVCYPCLDAPTCSYDLCGASADMVTATCNEDQGTWSVASETCAPAPCGTQTCAADQVCVGSMCADNPCVDQPLSCECAGSLCPPPPDYLCSARPRNISCFCQTC